MQLIKIMFRFCFSTFLNIFFLWLRRSIAQIYMICLFICNELRCCTFITQHTNKALLKIETSEDLSKHLSRHLSMFSMYIQETPYIFYLVETDVSSGRDNACENSTILNDRLEYYIQAFYYSHSNFVECTTLWRLQFIMLKPTCFV